MIEKENRLEYLLSVIDDWTAIKFKTIADVFPGMVKSDPGSFKCGHTMGYKQCLLDLDNLIRDFKDGD